jgi:hypothetical protein
MNTLPTVQCFKCRKQARLQAYQSAVAAILPRGWRRLDVQRLGRAVLLCSDCLKQEMQKPKG